MNLKKQFSSVEKDIRSAIDSCINDSNFIGGKAVSIFENSFAEYTGFKECVSVGNGTDALEIALKALGLPSGSTVIVPGNSFIASAEAVIANGLNIRWVDCAEDFLIDNNKLRSAIDKSVSAIIAVNLYGKLVDISEIKKIIGRKKISLIEDCAQSHGAKLSNYKGSQRADIQCYSFYPGKNLGAYGDGGAICTSDATLANKCRLIANHGRLTKYNHEISGRNSRLDAIQAAILTVKLNKLDQWVSTRRKLAERYFKHLKELKNIKLPADIVVSDHSFHLFVIRTSHRDFVIHELKKKEIATVVHYPQAICSYEFFGNNNANSAPLSITLSKQILSIPLHDQLDIFDQDRIIKSLIDIDQQISKRGKES